MRKNKVKPPLPAAQEPSAGVPGAEEQLERWAREAEELLGDYPDLDLQSECESELFRHLLRGKLSMRDAYEMAHARELREAAVEAARQETEKRVLDAVRARGTRPQENGADSGSGFTLGFDPLRLGRKERKEIVKRMLEGDPDPYRRGKEYR